MVNIISTYFDFILFENKGVPSFVEEMMELLKNLDFKFSDTVILKENQISKKSIIKITYIDINSDTNRKIGTNFTFEDFDFNCNKFTIVNYNITTFKNTKKEIFDNILAHEIHHSYELYNVFKSTRTKEMNKTWQLNFKIQQFQEKNEFFDDFLYLLYKCLGIEINANIVGLYFKIKEIGISDKNKIMNYVEKDKLYEDIKLIGDFHPEIFIKYIKENNELDEIQKLVNEFNDSEIEIEKFFEKWNIFFKRQYKKYNEKINRLMDLIINQLQNQIFY